MKYRYIEQIWSNVMDVEEEALRQLYTFMGKADCIIPYGSGRSYSALKIPISQYAKIPTAPYILTPEDIGFPGNNMYEALTILSKRFKNILLLLNSGSGTSEEPFVIAEDFKRFIKDKGIKSYRIAAVTSNPDSPIGEIASSNGVVVKLKGRGGERVADFLTTGIMGDNFELGSLMLFQGLVKAIYLKNPEDIKGILKIFYEKIIRIFLKYADSELYNKLVEILARRSNVYIGGRGSAHEAATMLVIRLNHIKYAVGDHVYRARGSNTPRPRPGDLGILISCSGETPSVIRWAKSFMSTNAFVVAVVGKRDSSLARIVHDSMVIDGTPRQYVPRDFYMYVSFLLSPLPIELIERFKKMGLVLPESILRYYHSTVE